MSSIKIRSKRINGKTELRTLITHPMENGLNHDKKTNELIPEHYINTLTIARNDQIIITSYMGTSISKDPFFIFILNGGTEGDTITLTWKDNLDNSDTEKHTVV